MAEVVDAMPTQDGRSRYDWDSMTDGKPRRMRRGRDFHCKPRSLRSAALAYARRRGIKSQIRVIGDEVYVQLGESEESVA